MTLPDFLIIGAQKAGTTWLRSRLQRHPELFLPDREVHFFDKTSNFEKGTEWYRTFFADAPDGATVGEKTPDYLWTGTPGAEGHAPDPHRRIHRVLPGARLIAILREPASRAASALRHIVRSGRISPLHDPDELLVGSKRHLVRDHGVIDYGRYHRHLSAYLEHFSRERLLVLIFEEDVVRDPRRGLRRACAFLGVDPEIDFGGVRERVNPNVKSRIGATLEYYFPWLAWTVRRLERFVPGELPRPSDEALRRLREIYEPENERLFELLGRRIPAWEVGS